MLLNEHGLVGVASVFNNDTLNAPELGHVKNVYSLCNIKWNHGMRHPVHMLLLRLRDHAAAIAQQQHRN
jgi:hypothetical protein